MAASPRLSGRVFEGVVTSFAFLPRAMRLQGFPKLRAMPGAELWYKLSLMPWVASDFNRRSLCLPDDPSLPVKSG